MVNNLTECLSHTLDAASDESIAHAEVLEAVTHAGVGPVIREALNLIGFIRCQETQAASIQVLYDVGTAVRRPFAGQHRAGRTVNRIREGNRSFREGILVPRLRCALNLLRAFQVLPFIEVIAEIILLRDIMIHDIAQEFVRSVIIRLCLDGRDMAVRHVACRLERESEFLRDLEQVMRLEVRLGGYRLGLQWESACKEAVGVEHRQWVVPSHLLTIYRIIAICEDERAAAALHETVVGRIDDAPFDTVAEVPEGREDDAEVAPTLLGRRLQQAIDILKEDERRVLGFERVVNLPPENALLALDALSTSRSDRIVLTGETADKQRMVWDSRLVDQPDIHIDMRTLLAEMRTVAVKGILAGTARLPLVRPYRIPFLRSSLEPNTESADAGEQFTNSLVHRFNLPCSFTPSMGMYWPVGRNSVTIIS